MKPHRSHLFALALATSTQLQGADFTMTAGDAAGATSFNGAGTWSPAGAPVAGVSPATNNYFNGTFLLRTPAVANTNYTFAGNSLTITGTPAFNSVQALLFKGTGTSTITINNLTINGGNLRSASGDTASVIFAGNGLTVGANGMGVQLQGPTTVSAPISGSSFIRIFNSEAAVAARTFYITSGANTFTGNLELTEATRARVQLSSGANYKFAVGPSGTNNTIFGTGIIALNGIFNIDLTSAGTTIGNSWTLVNAATLTETYDATNFNIPGFTVNGSTVGSRFWDKPITATTFYRYNEATGVLSVIQSDTDADGLADLWEEQNFGDNDGIIEAGELEAQSGTGDADNDGANNLAEQNAGTNPNLNTSWPDVDTDGLKDAWEITNFGNITNQNASGDADGDHATNLVEFTAGTSPSNAGDWPNTDGDNMNDAWETAFFGNLSKDGTLDTDGDTYTDQDEHDAHTNPTAVTGTNLSPLWSKLKNRWSFNGSLTDSVGGSNATAVDVGANNTSYNDLITPTSIVMTGGTRATSDYVTLGTDQLPNSTTPVTIELWATQNAIQNWGRIFDFNNGTGEYAMMTWTNGTNLATDHTTLRDIRPDGSAGEDGVYDTNQPYTLGVEHHIVLTIQPLVGTSGRTKVTIYAAPTSATDLGVAQGSFESTINLINLVDSACDLGRSPFTGDNTASASYNEVRIWNGALNLWTREKLHDQGPDNASIPDTENDFLPDDWETFYFSNTTSATSATADNDGDLTSNRDEFLIGSNPNNILSTPEDIDADGLLDSWEIFYFTNITAQNGAGDPDNDGFTNEQEETNFTDPTKDDNDGDELSDNWEKSFFTNWPTPGQADPLRFVGTDDPDGDTYDNEAEETAGSNPTVAASTPLDLDGDGLLDTWEITNFTNITAQNGTGNPDLDGYNNEAEETAGSDPNLAASTPLDLNGDGITDGHKLLVTDVLGSSSFSSGLNWDDAAAPVAGQNYYVNVNGLRTIDDANPYTFAGDNLVFTTGGQFIIKGTGVITVPNLGMDGGWVANASNAVVAITLDGSIHVTRASRFALNNGGIVVNAPISGTKDLEVTGFSNVLTLNATNTWTGNMNLVGTTQMNLGSAGTLKFKPGATTVTNAIIGTGPATLNGAFNIDLSGAGTTTGDNWDLITTTGAVTIGSTFTVTGFTADAGAVGARKWTSGSYEYVEATGVLTRTAAVNPDSDSDGMTDSWEVTYFGTATGNGATDDFEGDGTDNLTEFRLGLVPNSGSSRFAATRSSGGLIQWPSVEGVTFTVKRSATLAAGSWTTVGTVPGTAGTASFTDPSPPVGKAFYQVLLEP